MHKSKTQYVKGLIFKFKQQIFFNIKWGKKVKKAPNPVKYQSTALETYI